MRLYSIHHKQTGLFFLGHDWRGGTHWNSSPIFWKTPDGIVRTLRRLGSDFVPPHSPYRPSRPENWAGFDAARLEHIEVIITDVNILGEQTLPAIAFFKAEVVA